MVKKRILELDAFRGIAAVMVVCFHYVLGTEFKDTIFKVGGTGVDLFYIISGYVILMTVERAKGWKDFVLSRFSRLYPTFWAALLFTSTLYLIFKKDELTAKIFAGNITMIPHILGIPEVDNSYWSLAVEFIFYVLITVALITRQIKNIEWWVAAGLLFIFSFHFVSPLINIDYLLFKISYRIEFLNQAPLFFAGIIFYKMHNEKPTILRHLLVLCSLVLMFTLHPKGRMLPHISFQEHLIMLGIYFTMFYLFVYGLIGWIINGITLFLGKISYSLYLIHQYFSIRIIIPYLRDVLHLSHAIACVVSFAIVIATAGVFAYYIEFPLHEKVRAALKRYTNKPAKAG
ncbi:MAG: acyltransferase [Mucilaginibacter sp.]